MKNLRHLEKNSDWVSELRSVQSRYSFDSAFDLDVERFETALNKVLGPESEDLRVSGNHLGDLTVAPSICRDLGMGECESRLDLVKRVVKAVQKRKWHTVSEAVLCVAEAVANMNLRR